MNNRPFQVGDRVFALETIDNLIPKDTTGTVVLVGGMIGVSWDYTHEVFHDCNDHCKKHTGWFVCIKEIAHLNAPPPIDPAEFFSLLKGGSYA